MRIRHHLIDVGLSDSALSVIYFPLQTLPLGVDDEQRLAVLLYDDVRPCCEPTNAGHMINQRVTLGSLQNDLEGRSRECPLEHSADEFLKKCIHLEQQRKASSISTCCCLETISQ